MTQEKSILVTSISVEEVPELTLEELCDACGVSAEWVDEIVEYGAVEPLGDREELRFSETDLRRIRTILRLQNDLEINVAGAALVVDLIEEIEQLHARVEVLEKYFKV